MKKYWPYIGLLLIAGSAFAAIYSGTLVNNPALAYNSTYVIDMNTVVRGGITSLSAQAVYASTTIASSSFTDGSVSTGAVTVASNTGLNSNVATDQITLANTAALLAASATDYLVVGSTTGLTSAVITYNGNAVRQGHEWTTQSTASGTATSIATALGKYYGLTATPSSTQVNLAFTPGASGNGIGLSSNVGAITVGGAKFGGGHNSRIANVVVTANGQNLRQGYEWLATDTSSGTATALAAILNHVTGIHASASGSVVYATATVAGTAANSYTLVSNAPSYVTVANPTFTGGVDNAYVRINATTLTQGTNWTAQSTSSGTAKAISDAVNANSTLNLVLTSTSNASGVITLTSKTAGISNNFPLATNTASITLTGAAMTGGTTPAFTPGSSILSVSNPGFQTAVPVLYTAASTALAPLTSGTTYYTARLDASHVALATSKANAQAGTYITVTSSTTTGPHSYTLAPLAYTGTAGFFWEASNDGTNYNPIGVSSVTYSSPSTSPTTTSWDFGPVGLRYVRLNVTAPTTGGLNLVVNVQGN